MDHVLVARLVCSDPACLFEGEEVAGTLDELATLACDCGCGLEVLSLSEEGAPPVVAVRFEADELELIAA